MSEELPKTNAPTPAPVAFFNQAKTWFMKRERSTRVALAGGAIMLVIAIVSAILREGGGDIELTESDQQPKTIVEQRVSRTSIEQQTKALIEKTSRENGTRLIVSKIRLARETSNKYSGIAWLSSGDKLHVNVVFDGELIHASWYPTN